jgi:hypothetical protein
MRQLSLWTVPGLGAIIAREAKRYGKTGKIPAFSLLSVIVD